MTRRPVTMIDVVLPDGTTARMRRVFCPREGRSASLAGCRDCPFRVAAGPEAVLCAAGSAARRAPASTAAALAARTLCVCAEAPVDAIDPSAMADGDVIVVDARMGYVGVAARVQPGAPAPLCVGDLAVRGVPVVTEDATVDEALACAAAAGASWLPVIARDGSVVGRIHADQKTTRRAFTLIRGGNSLPETQRRERIKRLAGARES
jgi:hypothetical protein